MANAGQRKIDSINGNVSVGVGREWTHAQCNQCFGMLVSVVVMVVVVVVGVPGGRNMAFQSGDNILT